jgi:subtilisin-like proprotein convertase family protein
VTVTGINQSIPSFFCQNIVMTANANIIDVKFSFAMDHTWIGDVKIDLIHPDSTVVTLVDSPGGGFYGDNSWFSAAYPLTLVDSAPTDAENMGATIGFGAVVCQDDLICSFNPHLANTLADFVGKPIQGTWTVCFSDSYIPLDTGLLQTVTLSAQY